MKHTLLILLLFCSIFSLQAKEKLRNADKEAIEALMKKQETSWNSADLNRFMETYWKSPDLVFVGSGGPVYGWQQTLDRYKKSYPDKEAMGKLSFNLLNMYSIDSHTAFLIGKFHLIRNKGDLQGHFTLVLQKVNKEWLIISDHSSSE